jgi:hypothetical protein
LKKHRPSDTQMHIRLPTHELDRLRTLARKKGLTMTGIVLLRLKNAPVPDLHRQRELTTLLEDVTREINHIGNNINQATMHLHILRRRRDESQVPVFEEFNRLFRTYLETIEALGRRLDEIGRT